MIEKSGMLGGPIHAITARDNTTVGGSSAWQESSWIT